MRWLPAAVLALIGSSLLAQPDPLTLTAAAREGRVYLGGIEAEAAWANAEPLVIPIESEVIHHPPHAVTLRALVDGERLYLRIEWPDEEADTSWMPWRFTGEAWERLRTEDDGVQIIWETPQRRFDRWTWWAHRTGAVGHMGDSFGPPEQSGGLWMSDPGTPSFRGNGAIGEELPSEVGRASELAGPPIPDPGGWVMRSEDHLFEGHTEPLGEINPWTGEPWAEGDTVPGVVNVFPTESQADVEAVGTWDSGTWILEIRRRLDTGDHDHDIVFRRASTVPVSLSFPTATPGIEPVEFDLIIPSD